MPAEKENAKIIVFEIPHPVYASLMEVFSSISKIGKFELATVQYDSTNSVPLFKSSTNYLQYTKQHFDKRNIYLLHSPLFALGTWEALLKGVPFVGISEYIPSGGNKDKIVRFALSPFKKVPFVTHTKRSRDFLKKCGFEAVFVIPPAEKKRQGDKERKHILFVGKLIESKNVFLLLKIAAHFKEEKFVIIGKGPLSDELSKGAKDLRNVEIIPSVQDRDALFEYYSQAKMLVHPAIKDPVGFVVMEALSTQTPTIVSSGAGASDYLPPSWVADPHKETEWVSKIGQILNNQNESIKEAERIFSGEHLGLGDPFFETIAASLYDSICSRWPHLAKERS